MMQALLISKIHLKKSMMMQIFSENSDPENSKDIYIGQFITEAIDADEQTQFRNFT